VTTLGAQAACQTTPPSPGSRSATPPFEIASASYSQLTSSFTLFLSIPPDQFASLSLVYTLDTNGQQITLKPEEVAVKAEGARVVIVLSLSSYGDITDGKLIITEQEDADSPPGDSTSPSPPFPITLSRISHSSNAVYLAAVATMNDIRTPSIITGNMYMPILMPIKSALALNINKVISSFLYLRYIDCPHLIYMDAFFELLGQFSILSLVMDNPVEKQTYCRDCKTPEQFVSQETRTNILYNCTREIFELLIIVLISTSIFIAFYLLIKRKQQEATRTVKGFSIHSSDELNMKSKDTCHSPIFVPRKLRREIRVESSDKFDEPAKPYLQAEPSNSSFCSVLLSKTNEKFGLKYIIGEMTSKSMEWMCYCLLNIFTVNGEGWTIAGFLVSIIYVAILSWIFYSTIRLYLELKVIKKDIMTSTKGRLLNELPGVRESKFFIVSVLYEHYRADVLPVGLLVPIVESARCFIIPLLLFIPSSICQITCILLVEIANLLFTIYSRVKVSKWDYGLDILNSAGMTVYLILQTISLFDISEFTRQHRLGLAMFLVVATILALNLVYGFALAFTLYSTIIKRLLKGTKNNKISVPSKVSLNELSPKQIRVIREPSSPFNRRKVLIVRSPNNRKNRIDPIESNKI